jgi:osmoprotectant transport system ATP-binding protein
VDAIRHRIGYVIQDGGLFPHLTHGRIVTLLPRYLKRDRRGSSKRVAELAALVRISAETLTTILGPLGRRAPARGSDARAHAGSGVLLLDEPLAALDPIIGAGCRPSSRRFLRALKKTVVMVTHDLHEAAWFGDEIVLMRDGRIVQRGSWRSAGPSGRRVCQRVRARARADPRLAALERSWR